MSAWVYLPVLLLLAALQTALVPGLAVGSAIPSVVMCWVVGWAVVRGRGEAMPMALIGGLALDLLSRQPMGAHVVALSVVAFLVDLGHRVMHGSTILFLLVATLAASAVYGLVLLAIGGTVLHAGALRLALSTHVLPAAIYNVALMLPMFLVLRAIDRRFPVSVLPDW